MLKTKNAENSIRNMENAIEAMLRAFKPLPCQNGNIQP